MWNGDNTTIVCKYDLKVNVVNNLGQRNFFLSQQIPFCQKKICKAAVATNLQVI